ncbi:cytochrome P450 [Cohnella endophytica]|uniref:Cytochrome P450 n=1 Tax=Cohnella endophytica TaxID=2419778 RepID=A0A494XYL0_9BACL|nr:cytochrome P450 [Cohnella endophytica]RKP54119.1 cytochrome P450 [Cohnella endophytica]
MAGFAANFIENPYAVFREARQRHPVLMTDLFGLPMWLVTGYKEAEALLKDARFVREAKNADTSGHQTVRSENSPPEIGLMRNMMLFRDAPDHTRLRNLVNKAFTPRMVQKQGSIIESIADELLDDCRAKPQLDLIRDYSYMLPAFVIAELLGMPKEDRVFFRKWSDAFFRFMDFNPSIDNMDSMTKDIEDAKRYFEALIETRKAHPQDDLISRLIEAKEKYDQLTTEEMVATCMLLVFAGHDTSGNLITNGYKLLLDHPEMYNMLRGNPALFPAALEEILRYQPPILMAYRVVSDALVFAGQAMQQGEVVMIALAGANRDPSVIHEPEDFNIVRTDCKHLSFSSGPHFCLGAPLAKLEGEIALRKLVTRLIKPEIIGQPQWKQSIIFRGYQSLHIRAEIV